MQMRAFTTRRNLLFVPPKVWHRGIKTDLEYLHTGLFEQVYFPASYRFQRCWGARKAL